MTPRIIITCGDVNGIGLECLLNGAGEYQKGLALSLAVDKGTLADYVDICRLDARIEGDVLIASDASIDILDLHLPSPVEPGRLSAASGAHAIASLERAAQAVLDHRADAVVTLPICKKAVSLAGFGFPGQTEFFGARWGGHPLMILAWQNVRVALATIHVPLREVSPLITKDHVADRIGALAKALRSSFGVEQPRIAVLGLNPHAGENGSIGSEEVDVIRPAIETYSEADPEAVIEGPFPADGLFGFGEYQQYDGILAMYHDQGLIPLKLLAQGGGVNITAGLSYERTSPDHGTAFGIAGRNAADPASTIAAISMAADIVRRRTI